jgi:NAD(P)H dehydrogenase (quinone)
VSERIAVIGAAGRTGLAVLRALAARDGATLAVTRTTDQAESVLEAGASETTTADYASVAELSSALQGVDRVVVIPPSYTPEHVYIANATDAASAAGVRHLVLHSVLHPHTPTMHHHMRKAAGEAAVRAGATPWTILQPAMYAQTVLAFANLSPEGRICAPFDLDAPFTVIDLQDIAEVTAMVLESDEHRYASYELVGNPPVSIREMLRLVAERRGIEAEPVQVHPWELELPAWLREGMSDFAAMCDEYTRHGLLGNANVARWLLGREPTPFAEVVRRDAAAPLHARDR